MARQDPLPAFCFKVTIAIDGQSAITAFFKSCGGISMETEVTDYRAGGVNDSTYKLVGATKWKNIVLKRGFTASPELMDWRAAWLKAGADKKRATVTIEQMDTDLTKQSKKSWTFVEGWPAKWEISEFDASKNEITIETLEIAHHGIRF